MALIRLLLTAVLLFESISVALGAWAKFQDATTPSGVTTFAPLHVGAGGFLTGGAIAADGTKVARTDTFGAYYYNPTAINCGNANRTGCWQQLITGSSMPIASQVPLNNAGVYEIAIAPSNTARFYLFNGTSDSGTGDGCLYVTTDHGTTWTKSASFTCITVNEANTFPQKTYGPYIAVDPINECVVWVGTPGNGVLYSADCGSTWTQVSTGTIPGGGALSGAHGGNLIAYDRTSATSGGKTQGLYITSYGTGVYRSVNASAGASATFSQLNTTGMPTTHQHLVVDQTGVVWIIDASGTDTGKGQLNKYAAGAWSKPIGTSVTNYASLHTVAVDPGNASNIYVGQDNGDVNVSVNGGSTWSASVSHSRTATDIPWLAWTNENYMSNGDQIFDPVDRSLWFFEGIGVWRVASPGTTNAWVSFSAAIEQLNSEWMVYPWFPGAGLVPTYLDRPAFLITSPTTYPSTHGLANPITAAIVAGHGADWTPATAGFVEAIGDGGSDQSGYSTDYGSTWTNFAALPTGVPSSFIGGSIAISATDKTNSMWMLSNDGGIWCTTNQGASWTHQTVGSGDTGWNHFSFLRRNTLVADRVNGGTFYAYNDGLSTTAAGIYKTSSGCGSWSQVYTGFLASGFNYTGNNSQMRSVPGVANDLFFASGTQGSFPRSLNSPSTGAFFYECTGSGALTCNAVPNVLEVWGFGFGKPKPAGSGYPAIYIYGWVSNVLGVWRSDDHGVSWTQLSGAFPCSMDQIVVVEGDANTYGTVYLGHAGSGACVGTLH